MIFRIRTFARRRLPRWAGAACAALVIWPAAAAATDKDKSAAGDTAYRRGAFSEAAANWEQALRVANPGTAAIKTRLKLAAAYQGLGKQLRAVELLREALAEAEQADRDLALEAKRNLGVALGIVREHEAAEELLRESLEGARAADKRGRTAAILNDLGNLLAVQGNFDGALKAFAEGISIATRLADGPLLSRAFANAAATAARAGMEEEAKRLNSEALQSIDLLPASHEKVLLLLTVAHTDQRLGSEKLLVRAHRAATEALQAAEEMGDRKMASYALGLLGQLYRADGQLNHALSLTRRASFAAQQAQAPDALYRWEWQAGRILQAQGESNQAIAAYRRAVETLQPIRHDLALGYGNAAPQLSFRESLGPLFFELADLLLAQAAEEKEMARRQVLLRDARETVEQLKAVELEDYFQDDCVNVMRAKSRGLDALDPKSAVVYLVPLENRTEVLVSLSSGIYPFRTAVGRDKVVEIVRDLRRNLETRTTYAYLEQAQELYNLIVRPARDLLLQHEIKTIVFVPDGALQTIPLAALHDGEKFLVEEFAVAITPGLSLIEPRPIGRRRAHVLLSGLSDSVQGFPSLDFVPIELERIESEYRSEKLLNNSFVMEALEKKLLEEQFSIVHIASHGQFSREARNTFVLTYDDKLTLNKLEALIRPSQYRGAPVELLVLSACQTAAGDDRAALGLAGIAIKAGARSALASLWFVNDQSTAAFISELYEQLRQAPEVSRAEAVQAAQLTMLRDRRYRHPCYWAPYLMIGNWL